MGHIADVNKGFEITAHELRAIVADNTWLLVRELFTSFLKHDLGVFLGHLSFETPTEDGARL